MSKQYLAKIVYFDEQTALDYVEIKDNGHYIKEIQNETKAGASTEAGLEARSPSLFSILSLKGKAIASAEAQRIVRNTVSNTILTDFIKKADKDNGVKCLSGYNIKLTEETRLTIHTAITDAANGNLPMDGQEEMSMDISKFGSVLRNLQGYLECHAVKEGEPTAILRFNSNSFRNNYKLADIINMDLNYYCVKVGTTSTSTLKSLGLDLTNQSKNTFDNIDKLLDSPDLKAGGDELEVYDIILAGVFNNDAS